MSFVNSAKGKASRSAFSSASSPSATHCMRGTRRLEPGTRLASFVDYLEAEKRRDLADPGSVRPCGRGRPGVVRAPGRVRPGFAGEVGLTARLTDNLGLFAEVGYEWIDRFGASADGLSARVDFSGLVVSAGLAASF